MIDTALKPKKVKCIKDNDPVKPNIFISSAWHNNNNNQYYSYYDDWIGRLFQTTNTSTTSRGYRASTMTSGGIYDFWWD